MLRGTRPGGTVALVCVYIYIYIYIYIYFMECAQCGVREAAGGGGAGRGGGGAGVGGRGARVGGWDGGDDADGGGREIEHSHRSSKLTLFQRFQCSHGHKPDNIKSVCNNLEAR